MTVSKVMHDAPDISSATKARVRALAEEMGYVPNAMARSLRNRTTMALGVVIPAATNPIFGRILLALLPAGIVVNSIPYFWFVHLYRGYVYYNGKEEKIDVSQVDVSMNGIELQDREFFAAIRDGREPNASVAQVLPCYEVLHRLEQQLA